MLELPIYLQNAVYCTKNSPCCRKNINSHIYKADAINFTDSSLKILLEQYSYDHMRIVAHGDCVVLPQHRRTAVIMLDCYYPLRPSGCLSLSTVQCISISSRLLFQFR